MIDLMTIAERRVHHQLLGAPAEDVLAAVRHLGAVQAQDYAGALWSIGQRSGATRAEVEAAIARRDIVRTWPMRGTLHFVPAEDARWMLALDAEQCDLVLREAVRQEDVALVVERFELLG